MRYCTTSRKVAGSFPDGLIGFFIDFIFPEPTHPLTQCVLGVFLGGKYCRFVRLTPSSPSCAYCLDISENSNFRPFTGLYRVTLSVLPSKSFQPVQNKNKNNCISEVHAIFSLQTHLRHLSIRITSQPLQLRALVPRIISSSHSVTIFIIIVNRLWLTIVILVS